MQAEQQYQMLAPRQHNPRQDANLGAGLLLPQTSFISNLYPMTFANRLNANIYEYSFSLPSHIPDDSALYVTAVYSVKPVLIDVIGLIGMSGRVLWGDKLMLKQIVIPCRMLIEGETEPRVIEMTVKQGNIVDFTRFNTQKISHQHLHILKGIIKGYMRKIHYHKRSKTGEYFNDKLQRNQILDTKGLSILQGYRLTLRQLHSSPNTIQFVLSMQVNQCSRILQSPNLLQHFSNKPKSQIIEQLTGAVIITKYGRYHTYTILQINYDMSPLSTFYCDKMNAQVTYVHYYREVYGIKIEDLKQPLIKVKDQRSVKMIMKQAVEVSDTQSYIYLVPQLVSTVGMSPQQTKDREIMSIIRKYVSLSPKQSLASHYSLIQSIHNEQPPFTIQPPKQISGYLLPAPSIQFASQTTTVTPDQNGEHHSRQQLYEPYSFKNWVFVYSSYGSRHHHKSSNQRYRRYSDQSAESQDALHAVSLLKRASKVYGIFFSDPIYVRVQASDFKTWTESIEMGVKKFNNILDIVVVNLLHHEQKLYQRLKDYLTNNLKVPSQFIRKQTLRTQRGAMSAASKIAIQMNAKVGCAPWRVKTKHEYFQDKNCMYGAISISKGKKGFAIAFVGSISDDFTQIYSECVTTDTKKQAIPSVKFEEMYTNWVLKYYKYTGKQLPALIILYLEGLSMTQSKHQIENVHVRALNDTVSSIREHTGKLLFDPKFTIATVTRKISTRLYKRKNLPQQGSNPYTPEVQNVNVGSIITTPLSQHSQGIFQFHLVSQYTTQGTCLPTLYRVGYDSADIPQQAMISFSWEQCFNYYNWDGSVRFPACLQCANKLSKLVSMQVMKDIVVSELSTKQFFL